MSAPLLTRDKCLKMIKDGLADWFYTRKQPMPETFDAWELALRMVHLKHRRIDVSPRQVRKSVAFQNSIQLPIHQHAVNEIIRRSNVGEDLNPFLSTEAVRTGKSSNDALLNDWGIHHFHLGEVGTGIVDRAPRTNDLLFVVVQPSILYLLDILDHSSFENIHLFKILETDFPELIDTHQLDIIELENPINDTDRRLLREAGINTITSTANGFYFGPGGGVTTSGRSMLVVDESRQFVNRLIDDLQAGEVVIRKNLRLLPTENIALEFRGDDAQPVPVRAGNRQRQ